MRHTFIADEEERIAFVRKAAEWFEQNPHGHSFTDGDIEPGCWLGLRWGLGDDCVLLLRLDEYTTPTIYGQAIDVRATLAQEGDDHGPQEALQEQPR